MLEGEVIHEIGDMRLDPELTFARSMGAMLYGEIRRRIMLIGRDADAIPVQHARILTWELVGVSSHD